MDEKIILDLLNRNFNIVITESGDFAVATKNTINHTRKEFFIDIFVKLIGDFKINDKKTSKDVFYTWCDELQRDIIKNLTEYLDTLELKMGSNICFNELIEKFESTSEYSVGFLTKRFDEYYFNKSLSLEIGEFFDNFDFSKGSQLFLFEILTHFVKDNRFLVQIERFSIQEYKNRLKIVLDTYLNSIIGEINSVKLINNVPITIEKEIDEINEFIYNYLNDWYARTHLNDKVDSFLNELVVTLGNTNWVVTWIGHGPIDKKGLLSQFIDENNYHEKYIAKKYNDWYENAIITKSEKIMNISY